MKNLLLVLVLFLGGCSYKHDNLYMSNKKTTEQGVANTKKVSFPKVGKPEIFVTITYLNSIDNKKFVDKKLEQFVVGIHNVSMNAQNKHKKITIKDVIFDIGNSDKFTTVKEIPRDAQILSIIPASNPWSQYYLVQTPRIDKNFVNFSLEILPYPKVVLAFEKDY
ncbi:MAG: hypothetical protein GXP61_10745 [Epsilonproteobacteria bacterium]|nr:hypothetical protein [Campylobacterota bacterium]